MLWWRGDLTRAMEAYTTALELTREFGQPADVANALYNLALGTGFEIGVEDGLRLLDEAQTIYESLGDTNGLGDIAWGRGNLLSFSEDYVEASHHLVRSADLYRQAGNEFGMGWAMFEVGGVALRMGDPLGAWPYARDGLQLFAHHNDVSAVVLFLTLAAGIAYKLGDLQRAYRAAGAFHGLRISSGTDLATIDFNVTVGLEFETLEALDPGPLRDAYEAGKKLTYERAIEYALSGPGIEVSS